MLTNASKKHALRAVCTHSGPVALADSVLALQSKDGRSVCLMDLYLYLLSRFAPPCGNGEGRNRGVPDVVGEQTQYLLIDTSTGAVGAANPVRQNAGR